MCCKECTGYLPPFRHFATDAIHFGQEPEQWSSWAVVPPITLSATFKQESPKENKGYTYTRSGNPSRHVLEKVMTALDGAKHRGLQMDLTSLAAADGGKYCLAYSSGMAAILNICHLLKPGDAIICIDDVYGGTRELFDKLEKDYNIKVYYVDCTNLKELEDKIKQVTKSIREKGGKRQTLVWLESPTNPTLKVIDIKACADVAHKYKDVLVAMDNSLMSPYFQRPLSLGADICMSSATKYINGHCDVLMGLVSVNRDDLYESLKHLQTRLGAVPSPFDCYMCNRGLKTLHIRMKLHFKNGLAVAKFLESHPRVEKVIYPGLPSHPQHEVMKKQCTGVSGVLSFYIKGRKDNAFAFLKHLKVFTLAYNLGAYESLAEHPATMTHASVPEKEREKLGITDTLIRLSVGLEDEEDLLADLDQALKAAASMRTDERKRNSLAWTQREEQKQSHSSHQLCALFPGSMASPWAAFGEGFHPSSQLSTHFCSVLDQAMGSLDPKFLDTSIKDCTTNTCLKREVPQEVTWSCSCLFPDIWLVDLGFLGLLLGCALLSLCSGCFPQGLGSVLPAVGESSPCPSCLP